MAIKPTNTGSGLTLLPTQLANQGARLLPASLANQGAQLIGPGVAGNLAGTQYNQAIADAQAALQQQRAGGQQSLQNVTDWWNQIMGNQAQSAQRSAAIGQAVQGAEQSDNQGILNSLGGAANPGASSVAAAGQNNAGTLAAINAINGQYNESMSPILALGAAGAKGQQQNANTNAMATALQNIQDLTAQKGATQAQDQYQIDQQNNTIRDNQATRLLNIDQANNQTRDNRVSTLASIVGANNSTTEAQLTHNLDTAQLSDQEKSDARTYALNLAQLHDGEKQNNLATIMALGTDPATGTLTADAAKAIGQLTGLDPKALTGTSASIASKIITTNLNNNTRTQLADQKAGLPDATLSKQYGYRVDATGAPIGGHVNLLPGWSLGKGGNLIPPATSSASSKGELTANEASSTVRDWLKPSTQRVEAPNPDAHGNPVFETEPGSSPTYADLLQRANTEKNPTTRARLVDEVKTQVPEGQYGRPYTGAQARTTAVNQAKVALQKGDDAATTIKNLIASGLLPPAIVHQAVMSVFYSGPYSPVAGSPHYTQGG